MSAPHIWGSGPNPRCCICGLAQGQFDAGPYLHLCETEPSARARRIEADRHGAELTAAADSLRRSRTSHDRANDIFLAVAQLCDDVNDGELGALDALKRIADLAAAGARDTQAAHAELCGLELSR